MADELCRPGWRLVQDNAEPHTMAWFCSHNTEILPQSPANPDLNPFENAYAMMEANVEKETAQSIDGADFW